MNLKKRLATENTERTKISRVIFACQVFSVISVFSVARFEILE